MATTTTNQGWLTLYEVMEATDLSYREIKFLVGRGELKTRIGGSVELYDADDVALCGRREPEDG